MTKKRKGGRKPEIEPVSLEAVKEAMHKAVVAEGEFADAIACAYEAGNSINQIALSIGINHRTVDRIVKGRSRTDTLSGAWFDGRRRRNWTA